MIKAILSKLTEPTVLAGNVSYGPPAIQKDAAQMIDALAQALAFFLDRDPENPNSWLYKREKAEELARYQLSGITSDFDPPTNFNQ